MYVDNGGRIASRTLHLRVQPNDTKVQHCYKHQGSNVRLVPSFSNRKLAFAARRKLLCFLLIVTTKIKLIRRGEGVIFTKMSLQRVFNLHASVLPSHYHIVFLQKYHYRHNRCQSDLVIENISQRTFIYG